MRRITSAATATAARSGLRLASLLLCCGFISAAGAAPVDPLTPSGHWTVRASGDASTPPMGWNSWNAFATDVDEAKVIGSAQAIVSQGLRDAGYRYVNIDDGWWLRRRQPDGRMIIRANLFPSAAVGGPNETSFRPFTDRIHALGLKAGIYTDIGRNACSQVEPAGNPNLPAGSVAEREVGIFGHVGPDIRLYFGDWGFDYIKVDACGLDSYDALKPLVRDGTYHEFKPLIDGEALPGSNAAAVRNLYEEVRDAIATVRPRQDFVLSICNWGTANVRSWGREVGNLWRTSADIAPTWGRMLHTFDSTVRRELYAGPGHWNDPDMLFIGHGDFDIKHLTEARSHFALWAITSSPLIIGYDLRNAPRELLDIWANKEVIAVDQDPAGNQGVLAYDGDDLQIIVKQLATPDEKAVVLLNRGTAPLTATLSAEHLKMDASQPITVRDLEMHADRGTFIGQQNFSLAPRETIVLKVRGLSLLPGRVFLSDMPARIHVAADGIVVLQGDPHVFGTVETWYRKTDRREAQQVYAGWGAPRADSTPFGRWMRVARTHYSAGLGVLGNSRLEVKADGQFAAFSAQVGVDDSSATHATVRFEVYGDGRLLAATQPLAPGQAATPLAADVRGARTIELVARQSDQDSQPAVADWGNAALSGVLSPTERTATAH